jgi:GT2 family glycosyltransferase
MAPLFRAEDTVARVDVISGACLMLTREAFEEVGHFSTNYFMYSEDVDLCYKLQARGRHNYYLGNASVVHHGGKSTASQETGFSTVVMRESKWLFLRKTRGLLYAVAYRLSVVAVALCRLAALISISVITLGAFRRRSINASYTRWRKSLSWSLGMEKWVGKLMHPSVSSTTVRVGASQQAQKATARNFD